MNILGIGLTSAILAVLLSFRFHAKQTRFEINRLAEHNKQYKILQRFLEIYPGILVVIRALALIDAILLTIFAYTSWGTWGALAVSFVMISVAFLFGKLLHDVTRRLIEKHMSFLIKYMSWAEIFRRIHIVSEAPVITSEHELLHIIASSDFMSERSKNLITNAIQFDEQSIAKIMTARDAIVSVSARDPLNPKLIDDLYNSGHKVFPVIQGNLDKIIGILYLDDVVAISHDEHSITDMMCGNPPTIELHENLEIALKTMCESDSTILVVEKDGKTVGLLTLSDIVKQLFSVVQ
ncbi:CBS domain-containing protein [Candidatus Saccharibacteria bacterium]|nr:CBS domain-containing protein [Candidatus Saccharibacteria bacterium]MCL1963239.1 CBS domain-containing protein [Candidatus Saccharibacteria bacterium]